MQRTQIVDILCERDGSVCYLCEVEFVPEDFTSTDSNKVTIDHIVPRSKGGADDLDNYGLAHFSCNQEKADRLFLPDGTLEPKHSRTSQFARRAHKRQILERFCTECWDGRMLDSGETCDFCGSIPGPDKWPWWAKQDPKVCDHTVPNWCWMCTLDLVERIEA
jgi:hypothetical protein